MHENRAAIAEFLAATPRQRHKLRKWNDPALRRQLVLAAIHMCECAEEVLGAADWLQPGSSYRKTAAAAALRYWKILAVGVQNLWPFDDEPSPFC